jgi:hypothetical protein
MFIAIASILALLFIVLLVKGIQQNKNDQGLMQTAFAQVQAGGFQPAGSSQFDKTLIAWDMAGRKVCVITAVANKSTVTLLDFAALRDSEVIKDGETIYKKSTLRTVGGAVAGGLLLGGVGAVVGGLSGDSKGVEKIKALSLKIYVASLEQPTVLVPFISEWTPEGEKKMRVQWAEEWNDRLSAIIDEVKTQKAS